MWVAVRHGALTPASGTPRASQLTPHPFPAPRPGPPARHPTLPPTPPHPTPPPCRAPHARPTCRLKRACTARPPTFAPGPTARAPWCCAPPVRWGSGRDGRGWVGRGGGGWGGAALRRVVATSPAAHKPSSGARRARRLRGGRRRGHPDGGGLGQRGPLVLFRGEGRGEERGGRRRASAGGGGRALPRLAPLCHSTPFPGLGRLPIPTEPIL